MKLLLILLLLSLMGSTSQSQVYKFKAVKYVCTRYQNQDMEPPEIKESKGIPVEFDMDSSILYIHSTIMQKFVFEGKPILYSEKDSIMRLKFNSIDKKGAKCLVTQDIYESELAEYYTAFIIEYPDKTYIYFLQRL